MIAIIVLVIVIRTRTLTIITIITTNDYNINVMYTNQFTNLNRFKSTT